MSRDLSTKSSEQLPREVRRKIRASFVRLYGDVVHQLNLAVQARVDQGFSQAALAKSVGQDRAALTRVLNGQAGTNLKTVAVFLAATNYRLLVEAVPVSGNEHAAPRHFIPDDKVVVMVSKDGFHWHLPTSARDETRPPKRQSDGMRVTKRRTFNIAGVKS